MSRSRGYCLVLLLLACVSQTLAQECRMDPNSRHDGCALPVELGNFQVSRQFLPSVCLLKTI